MRLLSYFSILTMLAFAAPGFAEEVEAIEVEAEDVQAESDRSEIEFDEEDGRVAVPGEDQPEFLEGTPAAEAARRTPTGLTPETTVYGRVIPMGESALAPESQYDKSSPAPKPVRVPAEFRKMYRHAAKHPSIVVIYRSYPPDLAEPGDPYVYVNVPGKYYHTTKTRQVHPNHLIIPKSEAIEKGYQPNPYSNPAGKERELNSSHAPK
jgi:hypothetical protein